MYREFSYDPNDEGALIKELVLQVRKVIGPFAAPKKIYIVPDLPKTRSGKVRSSTFLLCTVAKTFAILLDYAPYHAQDRRWGG